MDSIEQLLNELTETHGVPGYESPIRAVVRKYMQSLGGLSQDKIGIHSHSSIIHRKDYDDAVKLLVELITRLDKKQVDELTG
jgi:Cellulase M and related proteins